MPATRLLTPELQEQMCRLAREGHHQKAIAWECHVAPRTLRSWITETDKRYCESFALAFRAAQAEGLKALQKLAVSDAAGARWMLEKLYPKIFRADLYPDDEETGDDATEALADLIEQRAQEIARERAA